jgi:nucleoid-associated protein YgaU
MRRIRQGVAIVALLALLAGVPWVMAATIGNPLNGWGSLKAGDLSDSVIIDVLAAVVWVAIWVAWLQFAVAVVAAVNTAVRTSRRPVAGGAWAAGPDLSTARVPGEFTGIPNLARWLVAAALLIGTAAGVASTPARAFAAGPAQAPVAAVAQIHAVAPTATPATADHSRHSAARTASAGTRTYVIPRDGSGPDTYWDIAQSMLGSGERWHEIWALNDGRTQADGSVMTQAGLLMPGWTVLVPGQAGGTSATSASGVVTVKPNDNLTEIADDHGSTEPAVWARNEGRVMSDGRVFTDPNLIKPGDTIVIPGPAHTTPGTQAPSGGAPTRTTPDQPGGQTPKTTPTPGRATPSQPSTPASTAPSTHSSQADRPEHQQTSPAEQSSSSSPWGEVFAGFGAVLAAGLLGALVVRRRMSWRTARLGRTIASMPPHLVPAEKATLTHGSAGAPDGQFLDFALRSLAQATAGGQAAALPDVLAARMTGDELQLRLAEPHPSAPPAPWRVDESGLWWSVSVGAELPVSAANAGDVAAPYPTLVGVGYLGAGVGEDVDDDEQGGSEKWLVDLERAGAVALTGDSARCLDLGRFIAAGLAVNDWSHHVTVTMVGFGDELVPINPARLRYSEDLDEATALLSADYAHGCSAAENADTTVLDARAHQVALDSFMPHVLLVAPHIAAEHDKLNELLGELAARPDRASVAIVLAGDHGDVPPAGWVLNVDDGGRLSLPDLGTELTAQRLPREQAHDIAEMLHRAGEGQEEAVPPASGARPWEQFIDAAGSLRPEYTLPRTGERVGPVLVTAARVPGPADLPGGAGQVVVAAAGAAAVDDAAGTPAPSTREATAEATTLLPAEDEAYLSAAATTAEDLEVVAPRVPAEVGERVAETVSGLDEALASWRDPQCPLPRLTLLGPVELRAHGQTPQRIGYLTELAAYLVSRDHGATIDQIAEAFGVKPETAAARLKELRHWLGVNPRTGEWHLPDARKSKASRERGVSVYEIEDMLVDADLFQQLHLRGQARGGEAGIADLEAALELVIGEPYSQQRTGGYAWLRDNPVDEYLKVAVEKVAHTVASWALECGELDRAERAARTALTAIPYAEVPRLDLAAVLEARGSKEAAERLLREEVCNRDDDGNGPLDLSERTEQIRRRREWLSAS